MLAAPWVAGQEGEARRRAYLTELLAALPPSPHWNAWLARTGELPPDFSKLPVYVDLPDPLVEHETAECRPIKTKADWMKRRVKLKQLLQHYVTGTMPPPPKSVKAEEQQQERQGGVIVREVLLRNPTLAAARAAVQEALARYPQDTAFDDPMLGYMVGPRSF